MWMAPNSPKSPAGKCGWPQSPRTVACRRTFKSFWHKLLWPDSRGSEGKLGPARILLIGNHISPPRRFRPSRNKRSSCPAQVRYFHAIWFPSRLRPASWRPPREAWSVEREAWSVSPVRAPERARYGKPTPNAENLTFPTKVPSDSLGWIGSLKRTSDKSLFPMALGSCGHRITHQLRPINMNGRSILAVTSKLENFGPR